LEISIRRMFAFSTNRRNSIESFVRICLSFCVDLAFLYDSSA